MLLVLKVNCMSHCVSGHNYGMSTASDAPSARTRSRQTGMISYYFQMDIQSVVNATTLVRFVACLSWRR